MNGNGENRIYQGVSPRATKKERRKEQPSTSQPAATSNSDRNKEKRKRKIIKWISLFQILCGVVILFVGCITVYLSGNQVVELYYGDAQIYLRDVRHTTYGEGIWCSPFVICAGVLGLMASRKESKKLTKQLHVLACIFSWCMTGVLFAFEMVFLASFNGKPTAVVFEMPLAMNCVVAVLGNLCTVLALYLRRSVLSCCKQKNDKSKQPKIIFLQYAPPQQPQQPSSSSSTPQLQQFDIRNARPMPIPAEYSEICEMALSARYSELPQQSIMQLADQRQSEATAPPLPPKNI